MLGMIINIALVWSQYFDAREDYPKVTKCYDRFSNEIVGKVCVDDGSNLFEGAFIVTVFSVLCAVIVGGFLMTASIFE